MTKNVLVFLVVLVGAISAFSYSYHSSSSDSDEGYGGGRHRGPKHHDHGHGGGRPNGNNNNRGCGRGWLRFDRPSGGWCVKVFKGETSQAEAESLCQAQGATLSGLQDVVEITKITAAALPIISPYTSGSLWVGARRTAECANSKLTGTCTQYSSFQWTDSSTTGVSGFQWNTRQPDNADGNTQQCLLLLASSSPTVTDIWTWYADRVDDVGCGRVYSVPAGREGRLQRGYVCGKRPVGKN